MIKSVKEAIGFLYLCFFTITVLFLSLFAFKLNQINSRVLGVRTEHITNEAEIPRQINFWEDFVSDNPQYYEGWIELYNLTGNSVYLDKAREIEPNR